MDIYQVKAKLEKANSDLIKDCGVFFAFSDKQFAENKTPLAEGEKYTSMGMGGYLPSKNVDRYIAGMEANLQAFEQDIAENNLREAYINYELGNHEAWYTGDITSTKEVMIGTYTDEELWGVYRKYAAVNQD